MWTTHGFFELILTFLMSSYVSAQFSGADNDVCMSPNGSPGKCLNIKVCPDLLNLLQQKPLTESTTKFLQQSQCGYENRDPKVCCTNSFNSSRLLDDPKRVPINVENPKSVPMNVENPKSVPTNVENLKSVPANVENLKSVPMNVENPENVPENLDNPKSDPMNLENPNSVPMSIKNHPNLRLLGGGKQCVKTMGGFAYIVGGTTAGFDAYPFMALIAYRNDRQLSSKTEFQCGGTIINKRYILTAAHCVTNLRHNKVLYGVRVGEYDLSTEKDCIRFRCRTHQDFLIESYHYHPKYSTTTFMNDVALIRVDRDIDLTVDNAKPICLPIFDLQTEDYRQMTVAGWGTTKTNKPTTVLLEVSLPRFPQNECVNIYKRIGTLVTPKQMCYGGELGKDSCQGDSGGPLFSTKFGYYVQYGIVSYGPSDCSKTMQNFPGVYTRVDQYVDWILDNLRD